jgi:hypothetical protein
MNQTRARNQNFIQNNQLIQIRQGGLDKSSKHLHKTNQILTTRMTKGRV